MARCSGVWPNVPSAFITSASVFHSFVFSSLLKSWSTVVGLVPSNRTRTLNLFFMLVIPSRAKHDGLLRALEFAGEKIIHHQCRDESGDTKILLRIVIQHMKPKFIAAAGEPREKLVYRKFLFICPLGNRVQQSPPSPSQICARFN